MRIVLVLAAVALGASPALAHTGVATASGFAAGFSHPLLGLDHLLAMVSVGLFAALLGGRALWLVPAAFVVMMVAGAAVAMSGVGLPMVELAIAGSVVVLGLAVAAGRSLPVAAAMALVGGFALFHGHAHGTEMPLVASGFAYGAGFVVATALLHGLGLGAGLMAGLGRRPAGRLALRAAGGAASAAGLGMLAGVI